MYEIKLSLGDANFVVTDNAIQLKKFSTWTSMAHFHADYEIHIVLSGTSMVEIDGEDIVINGGEICLLAPKSSHYPKKSSVDLVKTNFSFNLTRDYAYRNQKNFSEFTYYDKVFKAIKGYAILSSPELIEIVKEILEIDDSEFSEHISQTAFANFFIKLAKVIRQNNYLVDIQTSDDSYQSKNTLKQRKIVEDFFQKRYNEQIGIEDLAKKLCLSVPQTHRIVKKIFGVGFKKILTKQRITYACMLINSKTVNLTEIAYQCGYVSYNGFLSAFKNYTGKSPKEYEKELK